MVYILFYILGYVTYQDVLDVIPYGDTIDVIELRGADVILVLEVSVTNLEADGEPSGGFLQTAGTSTPFTPVTQ